MYDLADTEMAEEDLKTCLRSSRRMIPFLMKGLISRIVTTWERMSQSHCGSRKYRSRKVASS